METALDEKRIKEINDILEKSYERSVTVDKDKGVPLDEFFENRKRNRNFHCEEAGSTKTTADPPTK